jgi:hypothetical protein
MKTAVYVCNVEDPATSPLLSPVMHFDPPKEKATTNKRAKRDQPTSNPAFGAGPDEEPLQAPTLDFSRD